jgi:MinD-like ATPase involved in chromosome partitioning or flagellar assembly
MFTSTRSSRELEQLAAAVQIPLSTGRRIAVAPAHRGAGTSTVAAALASVYAVRRADPVLVADAAEGPLTWRLGVAGGPTMAALARELLAARGGGLAGFARLLPRTGTGLWVLPGGAAGQPHLCRDLTRAMSRVFAVCVTDCSEGLEAPATAAVVSEAHALVLVTTATSDGVRLAYQRMANLVAAGHTAAPARVVVAVTGVDTRAAARDDVARTAFDRLGVPTVNVPYDRHLAGGGPIVPSYFAEGTTVAATRLAGLALTRARPL